MKLSEINPFLRYSGHTSRELLGQFSKLLCACDHRLFVPENGELLISADGKEYALKRGNLLFVRSGVYYRYLSASDDFTMFSFNFDLTKQNCDVCTPIPPENAEQKRRNALLEAYTVEELGDVFLSVNGDAPALAADIEREYRHGALFYEVRCGHLLADLLTLSVRSALRQDVPKAVRLVSEITGYIREHYAEDISNDAIARVFSYHPGYVNRLMVEHMGMSLHQYVNRTRVGHSLALLEGGNHSVSEVALMVGFSDLVHFSKTFRKFIGCSPSAYRPKR